MHTVTSGQLSFIYNSDFSGEAHLQVGEVARVPVEATEVRGLIQKLVDKHPSSFKGQIRFEASVWRKEAPYGGTVSNIEGTLERWSEVNDLLAEKPYAVTLRIPLPIGELTLELGEVAGQQSWVVVAFQ